MTDPGLYVIDEASGDGWSLLLGDSCERLAELPDESIDLNICSPPFASLYVYSPSIRDLGNCADDNEFVDHYRFVIREQLRLTKPGRLSCVHVQQLTNTKVTHGESSLRDFRGLVIRAHVEEGWLYHGEACVEKNPQASAVRTHSQALLFVQLRRDSIMSRPALADYVLIFRKPGENPVPVLPDVDNETWIEWANPIWYGIRESDTLNAAVAREDKDERHICPLQLPLIERCVRLWSNPGELVLSPFAGIGSEGWVALRHGRRFIGVELKRAYWEVACRYLTEASDRPPSLFDEVVVANTEPVDGRVVDDVVLDGEVL